MSQELGAQSPQGRARLRQWFTEGTFDGSKTEDSEDGDGSKRRLFAKGYTVFNAEQADGLKMPKVFEPKLQP